MHNRSTISVNNQDRSRKEISWKCQINIEMGGLLRGKSNLRVLRDIVIDDNINRWNVKSSTCHISTDKNIAFSSLELIQGSKSL